QLGFLLRAAHRGAAPFPPGEALRQGRVVEQAAAPQDPLQLTLLCERGPPLFLGGLVAGRRFGLFAPAGAIHRGGTEAVGPPDGWCKPADGRLTVRANAQWLAAG